MSCSYVYTITFTGSFFPALLRTLVTCRQELYPTIVSWDDKLYICVQIIHVCLQEIRSKSNPILLINGIWLEAVQMVGHQLSSLMDNPF